MTRVGNRGWPRCLVAAILALLTAAGACLEWGGASAQEAKGAGKKAQAAKTAKTDKKAKKAQQKDDYETKAVATEIREAFIDLQRALEEDRMPPVNLPNRPAKTTSSSTLTSEAVDALIVKSVKQENADVRPAQQTSDEVFLRRVSLDVTGTPPTIEQVREFVRDRDPKKRSKVIDKLLESPDYAKNWARFWRDVIQFRATNAQRNQVRFEVLEDWLTERIAANAPWDEVAAALITAEGVTDESGPANFLMAHSADPVEVAGEVSRIFMGLQIQCAQCHDHPYDSWKRPQFHQFAAFFAGIRNRPVFVGGMVRRFQVDDRGREVYQMPDMDDPTKQEPIAPRFTFISQGDELPRRIPMDRKRELLASYVTGQDNPWFAKAYANRVWAALVGEGFYNPVDDLGPTKDVKGAEALDALAADFSRTGYDVKGLFRVILNSKTYQKEVRSTTTTAGRTAFAANCSSRLRADQIWDSLAQALGFEADAAFVGARPGSRNAGMGMNMAGPMGRFARLFNPRARFDTLFGVDPSTPSDEVLGTIPQALALMNSPQIHQMIKVRPGTTLGKILSSTPDNAQAVRLVYLQTLSREPNKNEMQSCLKYIQSVGDRGEAFEDVLWSLINSAEFISRK